MSQQESNTITVLPFPATGKVFKMLVDGKSLREIISSEVDYVDSLMGAGFTVNNPNAVSSCGCGHSFKTADDAGEARGCSCGH